MAQRFPKHARRESARPDNATGKIYGVYRAVAMRNVGLRSAGAAKPVALPALNLLQG